MGLEDTSDLSVFLLDDLMFALSLQRNLKNEIRSAVKQLKNRYNDPTMNKRFVIGIDRAKMRLHDLEETESNKDFVDSNQKEDTFNEPVFDKTDFGEGNKFEYH